MFLIGRVVCSKSDSANRRSKLLRNSEIDLHLPFLIWDFGLDLQFALIYNCYFVVLPFVFFFGPLEQSQAGKVSLCVDDKSCRTLIAFYFPTVSFAFCSTIAKASQEQLCRQRSLGMVLSLDFFQPLTTHKANLHSSCTAHYPLHTLPSPSLLFSSNSPLHSHTLPEQIRTPKRERWTLGRMAEKKNGV